MILDRGSNRVPRDNRREFRDDRREFRDDRRGDFFRGDRGGGYGHRGGHQEGGFNYERKSKGVNCVKVKGIPYSTSDAELSEFFSSFQASDSCY